MVSNYWTGSGKIFVALIVVTIVLVAQLGRLRDADEADRTVQQTAGDKSTKEVTVAPATADKKTKDVSRRDKRCAKGSRMVQVGKARTCKTWSELVKDQRIYAVNSNGAKHVVCVPPKNGSTYHRGLIFRILGIDRYDVKHQVHFNEEGKERMFMVNFTNEEIEYFMTDPSVPRYALIRNPVTRALSGYINVHGRFEEEDKERKFQEFVMGNLTRKGAHRVNQHYKQQKSFCGYEHGLTRYKRFRVEEPEKYVAYLEKIVPKQFLKDGWPTKENKSFREFVLGPRKRTHGTDKKFLDYVGSVKVFDRLVNLYRDDIELLGYGKDVERLRAQVVELYEKKNIQSYQPLR